MSLKAFHVFFVAVCLVFAIGTGFWGIRDFRESGMNQSLYLGIGAFAFCALLGVYAVWFLKKLRHFSYI